MKAYYIIIIIFLFSCQKDNKLAIEKKDNPYYDKAFDFKEKAINDSAFFYFQKAKNVFIAQNDSFSAGKCLINMAIIQEQYNDNFGSQETSIEALIYFKKNDKEAKDYLISNYNNLGITNSNLENYDDAIRYYQLALNLTTDSSHIILCKNNIANALSDKKEHDKAIEILSEIIDQTSKKDKINYARFTTNLAQIRWKKNKAYNPESIILEGLNLRLQANDYYGQISSYRHLTKYYKYQNNPKALSFANKMYKTAQLIHNPSQKLEALQYLTELDPQNYKQHFNTYKLLKDSISSNEKKAKSQFALIRYETEKAKADHKNLQLQNEKQNDQIIIQWLISALIIVIAGGIFWNLYYWWKRKKRQMLLMEELKIQQERNSFSKKIHDEFSNEIYYIMSEVENGKTLEKTTLLVS